MVIRDSTLEDMRAVAGIYGYHVLNGLASFEEEAPSADEVGRRRVEVLGRGLPYLVAEVDGSVVGYSYASPYRARHAYRYTIENSVYVQDGMGGRGIGSALLDELIARCSVGLWRQMVAIIGDSGNVASLRLHQRAGFRVIGIFTAVGFKLGRWVDSVLMQRELGAGDRVPPADVNATKEMRRDPR
jgi:L-amino acid N-acyltransferase YncA